MSETKNKSATKSSKAVKSSMKSAQSVAIEQALANAPVEMVPLGQLAPTPLNVRKKKPDPEKLQELMASIRAVGVLQNLVVYLMPDGLLGVVAGGRRLAALLMLMELGMLTTAYLVPVKKVSEGMAEIISASENFHHEAMHPADQIAAFQTLCATGKTAADIGVQLGYSTAHVQKCLRLAGMAPALLDELAGDNINIEQLQALSASEDHQRQVNVWKNAYGVYLTPKYLRDEVLRGEVSAKGSGRLAFIGREAYERAGGGFRYDLFSDEGFISDAVLLDTLTREKLTDIAAAVALDEGWAWSEGRIDGVSTYGDDAAHYLLLSQPAAAYTAAESARLEALDNQLEALGEQDQADSDAADLAAQECQDEMESIEDGAKIRAWSEDVRARCGVVASLIGKVVSVRRGVMLHSDIPEEVIQDVNGGQGSQLRAEEAPQGKPLSAVLVKSLSSERTLAVQAALAEQPQKALVIFVHDCLTSTFTSTSRTSSPLSVTLHPKTGVMLDNAPAAKDGRAAQRLREMHDGWQAKLPVNWHKGWDWLLDWDTAQLIAVMGYCLATTVDGASERLSHGDGKAGKDLEPVEALLNFTLRDWWQPTKSNFFGRIGKEQISNCLTQAGLDGASRDALKLKKADAAELAESQILHTRWVPDCMTPDVSPVESDVVTVTDAEADNIAASVTENATQSTAAAA